MPDQTSIPPTPHLTMRASERVALYRLVHKDGGPKVKGQRRRVYLRFSRAFGLDVIGAAVRRGNFVLPSGESLVRISEEVTKEDREQLFPVTLETVEYFLDTFVTDIDHDAGLLDVLGKLFEDAEAIKAERFPDVNLELGVYDADAEAPLWIYKAIEGAK